MNRRVLGIETTCDDIGIAIYGASGPEFEWCVPHNDHLQLGGVVPELAARHHAQNLPQASKSALQSLGLPPELQAVAYSAGPGLLSPIRVGAFWAQNLAARFNWPLLPLDHLEAHIFSPFIGLPLSQIPFPFLALLVSGGHTLLWKIEGLGQAHYRLLGKSLDDAAGEALDKTARLLGLGYPGGPQLERWAQGFQGSGDGSQSFRSASTQQTDFSFSGLKSHFKRRLEALGPLNLAMKSALAAEVQGAIWERLKGPCQEAMRLHPCNAWVFVGGVSANRFFRSAMQKMVEARGGRCWMPQRAYAGDNGTMVAYLGYLYLSLPRPPFRRAEEPLFIYGTTAQPRLGHRTP